MDTIEEINGTYFYHGQYQLFPGELFDVIFLEQFCDELGLGIRVLTPVGVRMQKTTKLAAVIARYVPWLGWIGLVNSIYQVSRKTQAKYNLIARPNDRIPWTYF